MSLVRLNPRHPRSPKNLLLNDVLPDWDDSKGIFSLLEDSTAGVPWEDISADGLDIAYHGEHSGMKFVSPIVYKWLSDEGELTEQGINKIISAIQARYYQKWSHLWAIYSAEYNPLDTYNLTESGSKSGTSSMTHGHTITDSGTDTTTDRFGHVITDAGHPSITTTDQVRGFNSATDVNKAKSIQENVTDNTTTHSGSDSVDLVHGKVQTNSGTDSGANGETFSSTKRGTMYRAPGELLSLDRDFWLQDFFTIVFADVDDMLTLDIYPERTPYNKVF